MAPVPTPSVHSVYILPFVPPETDFWTILSSVSAGGAALVAIVGIFLWLMSSQQTKRAAQVQALSEVFSQIRDLEFKYHLEFRGRPDQEKKFWDHQFFNTVEYLCFLITHNLVRHRELIGFFRIGIIRWYEEMFVRNLPEAVGDPTSFPEFKRLYSRLRHLQA